MLRLKEHVEATVFRRPGRGWIGHNAHRLAAGCVVVICLGLVAGVDSGAAAVFGGGLVLLWVVLVWAWHSEGLCERCHSEGVEYEPSWFAPARFFLYHLFKFKGVLEGFLYPAAFLIGANLAKAPWAWLPAMLWLLLFALFVVSGTFHHRYAVWCPRCGGGGSYICEPALNKD